MGMNVQCQSRNGRFRFEFECNDLKDFFKKIAGIEEITEETCSNCNGTDLRFIHRVVEGNDYYELNCQKCHHKLGFGQNKVGGALFPRRKNMKTGEKIGKNGWHVWTGENYGDDDEAPPQQQTPQKGNGKTTSNRK